MSFSTHNPYTDFWGINMPPLFTVAFYLVSVAMYLVSFFLSKLALLKETEIRMESRILPDPQIPSGYPFLFWSFSLRVLYKKDVLIWCIYRTDVKNFHLLVYSDLHFLNLKNEVHYKPTNECSLHYDCKSVLKKNIWNITKLIAQI